jgi:hypothetical protein
MGNRIRRGDDKNWAQSQPSTPQGFLVHANGFSPPKSKEYPVRVNQKVASTEPPGRVDQPSIRTGQTAGMGFNPHRQYKRKRADLPIVVLALLIVGALVAWGFLG